MKKTLLLAAAMAALTALTMATTAHAETRQHWASLDGYVRLQPNGRVLANDSLEDRAKINDLFALWGLSFDEGQTDVIGSLFTDNGTLNVLQGSATPIVSNTGRDNIMQSVASAAKQQGDQRRHAISNVYIQTMDETHATAVAYGIVTMIKGDAILLNASVFYRANLEKGADGVWRFSELNIGMDTYVGKKPVEDKP